MRLRTALLMVGLALAGRSANASVLSFSAITCTTCWGGSTTLPDVDVMGEMTVDEVDGTFWNPLYGAYFTGPQLEVTDLTGSYNGAAITLAPPALGDGSWLYPFNVPVFLSFSVAGSSDTFRFIYDNANVLFQEGTRQGDGWQAPVSWNTAPTPSPEPPAITLTLLGILGICAASGLRRSLRPAHVPSASVPRR
jgi:hypothetical protein